MTDLVVGRKKDGSVTPTKLRGQRAINCSSTSYPLQFTAKVVDIALKNRISVHTKDEFDQLIYHIKSERLRRNDHRNKILIMQARKLTNVRVLTAPLIKVEDLSRKFRPIFKEFVKWPVLHSEEDLGHAPEQVVVEKVEKKTYCERCEEHVFKSELEIHCNGKRHKSITREERYWHQVNASISKLPSLLEFEDNCRNTKLLSLESQEDSAHDQ